LIPNPLDGIESGEADIQSAPVSIDNYYFQQRFGATMHPHTSKNKKVPIEGHHSSSKRKKKQISLKHNPPSS